MPIPGWCHHTIHNDQQARLGLRINDFPKCGDCWCIPSDPDSCPAWEPVEKYSRGVRNALAGQSPNFIYRLSCNPYVDGSSNCTTTPPQVHVHDENTVCGIVYDEPTNRFSDCGDEYTMKTYQSAKEAEGAGAFVTHTGVCGVCSTTKDLSVYMNNPDLEMGSVECAAASLVSEKLGLQCYVDLVLTLDCARIWVYDSINTGILCTEHCLREKRKYSPDPVPANGPYPECTLSDCLQCDEDNSDPIFTQFPGRNRRRSGLRSSIVRPCDGFVEIVHDSCPKDESYATLF